LKFEALAAGGRCRALWIFLLALGLARLASMAAYPLVDTTEARYGEIARIIVDSGNWIVPQIDYGVPFWGKPPLSFWASALSIEGFANSEFFIRLPHFLAALAVLVLIWKFARSQDFSRRRADISIVIVATSVGFLISAGVVMTDMFLCLAMAMVMVGFWRGWHGERGFVYLMYAGLGLGLLAKGPVILALAVPAIVPWLAIEIRRAGHVDRDYRRLRIPTGLLVTLLIAAPWYYLMERQSPGFLHYFIVGEHFQRFLDSGWRGDLYGTGHAHIRGTIWFYWLLSAFPWSLPIAVAVVRWVINREGRARPDPLQLFLVLWMCSPMLLFTLAGNVLPAYVLPGLPAIGMLTLKAFPRPVVARGKPLLAVAPLVLLAVMTEFVLEGDQKFSDQHLLSGVTAGEELYYYHHRPYSAQYYSHGLARTTEEFPQGTHFYLVTEKDQLAGPVDRFCELKRSNAKRRLYFCRRDDPA